MGSSISVKTKTALFGNYNDKSNMLRESLRKAGFTGLIFVLEDAAFMPEDMISVFHYTIRQMQGVNPSGKARYFNEIDIPAFWHIEANNIEGTIYDKETVRGKIYYSNHNPMQNRLVKQVDWYSTNGIKTSSDYYDQYGLRYGRMTYDSLGMEFQMSWFSLDGQEVLTENKKTGDFILQYRGNMYIFQNLTELTLYLMRDYENRFNVELTDILYNTLHYPFFVSLRWEGTREQGDYLFWQEQPREDIPGNMMSIFEHKTKTTHIYVQNMESYQNLLEAGADRELLSPLGFIYNYQKENQGGNEVLICTNSDQLEHLEDIVKRFPRMHFHVCAVTEMSQKLLGLGKYDNLSLYPSVSMAMVVELFQKCDYYLDINHGGQILDAVKTAYLYEQLIVGIEITVHNREYIAPEYIFADWEDMCAFLDKVFPKSDLHQELAAQKRRGIDEDVAAYQKLLFNV